MIRKFSFGRLLLAGVAFASILLLSTAQPLQAQPDFEFAKQWGNSNPIDFVEITSMTTNNAGEQIIAGQFKGNIDFDPGVGTYILSSSAGGTKDVFVLKLNVSGDFIWAGKIGNDLLDEQIGKVVTDNADNVYICGAFLGNIPFDFGSGFYLNSTSSETGFIAKYNTSGGIVYAKMIGEDLTSGTSTSLVKSVAVDKVTEEVYITGNAKGEVDLDPNGGVYGFLTSGTGAYYSAFTSKLDPGGNFLWANIFTTTTHSFASDIFWGADNNVYVLGVFEGSTPIFVNPAQGTDICLFKMNPGSGITWAKNMGGAGNDIGVGLAGDNNYVYVTGRYINSTFDFDIDNGGLTLGLENYWRGFLYQIDFSGTGSVAHPIGFGSGDTYATCIAANNNGVYVGGFYTIVIRVPGAGSAINAVGAEDGFVYKFNPSAAPLW